MLRVVLFICCVILLAKADYETAYEVYKSKDFTKSLQMFQELVDEYEDSDAAYMLGYMYENAQGCEKDLIKSQKYYKLSAKSYYNQNRADPNRNSKKEYSKFSKTITGIQNKQTEETFKQYVASLYNIQAYKPNYFLPISTRLDYKEYAPTGSGETQHQPNSIETEFQVSLKYDIVANMLGVDEIYTVAYTQLSFWQLYVESAYFRESNYNPEFFMTIPLHKERDLGALKAVRFGIAHQSNGRGGYEERSWNYIYGSAFLQYRSLFCELKLQKPWGTLKYNPDLLEYIGHSELTFILPYKKNIFKSTLRSAFNGRNSVKVSYSYPLFGSEDLFLYVNGFSGYAESLIDYDNKVSKLGFGLSISR